MPILCAVQIPPSLALGMGKDVEKQSWSTGLTISGPEPADEHSSLYIIGRLQRFPQHIMTCTWRMKRGHGKLVWAMYVA